MATYSLELDDFLGPVARLLNNMKDDPNDVRKGIMLYDEKIYLSNVANFMMVAAVVSAIWMNATAALVYGAIGWGVQHVVTASLREMEQIKPKVKPKGENGENGWNVLSSSDSAERINNIYQNLNVVPPQGKWAPEWVNICGWTFLRQTLPSGLTPAEVATPPNQRSLG